MYLLMQLLFAIYQIGFLFYGSFGAGTVVAFVVLLFMLFMLFRQTHTRIRRHIPSVLYSPHHKRAETSKLLAKAGSGACQRGFAGVYS